MAYLSLQKDWQALTSQDTPPHRFTPSPTSAVCSHFSEASPVAICALPLVIILPAVLLFGVGGYPSSKGYVECPDQLGGQRFPVIRKVLPEARALCADDVRSE
jgi:hypothetical protein